jgi:hypothetical protein
VSRLERREVALACVLVFVLSYFAGDCAAEWTPRPLRWDAGPSEGSPGHEKPNDSERGASPHGV